MLIPKHLPPLIGLVAALVATPAMAAATRLDDSASPRQRVQATVKWAFESDDADTDDQLNAVVADISDMEFRLRTDAFRGKDARIYLVIPRVIKGLRNPQAMRVEWTTRGRFISGTVLPGDRALVYSGRISEPLTAEVFTFRFHIDGRYLDKGLEFDPYFEIEASP